MTPRLPTGRRVAYVSPDTSTRPSTHCDCVLRSCITQIGPVRARFVTGHRENRRTPPRTLPNPPELGRHPAGLNYGDCFSYALAWLTSEPLLFVGDDFARTRSRSWIARTTHSANSPAPGTHVRRTAEPNRQPTRNAFEPSAGPCSPTPITLYRRAARRVDRCPLPTPPRTEPPGSRGLGISPRRCRRAAVA
jgi:hypothetical protein